eukprot:gene11472-12668_t
MDEDKQRSIDDWMIMSKASLIRKAIPYNIPSKCVKSELAKRLYEHCWQPRSTNAPTSATSTARNTEEVPTASRNIVSLSLNNLREIMKDVRQSQGPFTNQPLDNFRTSLIGVVPKKDSSKPRIVTDLSSPKGLSINDFIDDNQSAVSFSSFDTAAQLIASLGRGSQMVKLDVKSAFRLCPVHPADWNLLGFRFLNYFFVDLFLPMGLRSSTKRFTKLSNTIVWIMKNNYHITHCTHYLDDFVLAETTYDACLAKLHTATHIFHNLGVPLAPEKIVGPATSITFLGIEIDSTHMCLKLPQDKLSALQLEITSWFVKKKCTQRELLSLMDKLSFAAKIFPSGRTFLRRLIDLSNTVKRLPHHISINTEAQQNIAWWAEYLPAWNGKYKILDPHITYASSMQIFTDASGQLGFDIFCDGHWILEQWPHSFLVCSIQWKELFPIYVTCLFWVIVFPGKELFFIVTTRPLSIFGVLIPQNAHISCIYCVNCSFSRPMANTPC